MTNETITGVYSESKIPLSGKLLDGISVHTNKQKIGIFSKKLHIEDPEDLLTAKEFLGIDYDEDNRFVYIKTDVSVVKFYSESLLFIISDEYTAVL